MTLQPRLLTLCGLLAAFMLSACGTEPAMMEWFDGKKGGCSDFFIYRFNPQETEAITLSATGDSLDLSTTPTTFTLPYRFLSLRIDRFELPSSHFYCNDIAGTGKRLMQWSAESGRVTITATAPDMSRPVWDRPYEVSVTIEDATLKSQTGETITVDEFDFGTITVGWMPG